MQQLDNLIGNLKAKAGLDDLSVREKISLAIGGLAILGVLLFQFVVSPYLETRSGLLDSIQRKEQELIDIKLLKQEFGELQLEEGGIKENLEKREQGFTLFTFIDRQAESSGVKAQINYMKPATIDVEGDLNESVVELKLQGVTLEKLVRFMELTESDQNVVSIRRISIQTDAKAQGFLDVILQIVTFVEGESS